MAGEERLDFSSVSRSLAFVVVVRDHKGLLSSRPFLAVAVTFLISACVYG
jgi:hypothetical protein